MIRHVYIFVLIVVLGASFAPSSTSAVCFNGRELDANGTDTGPCTGNSAAPATVGSGIFSCSAPGATSIASTVAIGGTYVPVFDSAVALNTGVLTYKECFLREVVNKQKQAATLAMANKNYELISTGRDGNPAWVVKYGAELNKVREKAFVEAFQSELLSKLNPAFQNPVKTALVRNYQMTTQAPQNSLACPYQGDWSAVTKNPQENFSWEAIFSMANPNCNPVYAYVQAQDQLNANVAAAESEWQSRLNWNNGIYDSRDAYGNVVVPGIFLNAIGTQSITSGFRQLENVDDIGEMIGPLFAGIGTKFLSNPSSVESIQKYLDQAVEQQSSSLLSSYVSTALTNLYKILNDEQQYNEILAQEADILTSSINQLRGSEKACWDLVIQNVCASGASSTSCTGKSGGTLTIATSTAFSDAAIAKAGIGVAAGTLTKAVDTSNQNITTINSLIVGVQSTDATTRNTALANLDTIINAKPPVLHTQSSITKAQEDLAAVQAEMLGTLGGSVGFVKKTQQTWAGDAIDQYGSSLKGFNAWDGTIDPGTGWCNINKQSTLDQWTAKWSQ
ncbi:hypothetical protein A2704_02960 [Candidatus Kaiserbacteria bacterium RIFCSPHIGHO2_01_FULL_54_36b]|uniref:Uncharacterized protein n=1 Tax=Candidatus Kaiserbacteria bacterium RIFCSPHIGHO2_01_FULL_54_36b TaxID=1798483 RepID=A0A1F6CIB9_9BACT|nr:MAG: hypothetical protein A2704_02960 [Candidatus Kaiserbacteria bacterium RIFCSPHIGHO2_01_FULL_54_36b]